MLSKSSNHVLFLRQYIRAQTLTNSASWYPCTVDEHKMNNESAWSHLQRSFSIQGTYLILIIRKINHKGLWINKRAVVLYIES